MQRQIRIFVAGERQLLLTLNFSLSFEPNLLLLSLNLMDCDISGSSGETIGSYSYCRESCAELFGKAKTLVAITRATTPNEEAVVAEREATDSLSLSFFLCFYTSTYLLLLSSLQHNTVRNSRSYGVKTYKPYLYPRLILVGSLLLLSDVGDWLPVRLSDCQNDCLPVCQITVRTELRNLSIMLRYVPYRTRTELNRSLLELI